MVVPASPDWGFNQAIASFPPKQKENAFFLVSPLGMNTCKDARSTYDQEPRSSHGLPFPHCKAQTAGLGKDNSRLERQGF